MKEIKQETIHNVLSRLISWAGELNGNTDDVLMDGGETAAGFVKEAVLELAARYKGDPSLASDPLVLPVIEALAAVKDVEDAQEVSMAIRHLPKIPYEKNAAPQPVVRPNPFASKR